MSILSLWELLYPTKCVLCCQLLEDPKQDLCPQCGKELPELHNWKRKIPFSRGTTALWRYEGNVRQSLLRFKFSRKQHYAKFYGQALAAKLREQEIAFDVITWVPVSNRRRMRRGYDQGQLLSLALGRELQTKPRRCLRKIRDNPPQSTIKGEAHRRANVLGVYKAVHPARFTGKRILLLDDIITTGATISECTKVLLTAGAKEVHCAAIAAAKDHK